MLFKLMVITIFKVISVITGLRLRKQRLMEVKRLVRVA
jgi:hypothetical protein